MSKKDYEKIAKAFKDYYPIKGINESIEAYETRLVQYLALRNKIADILKDDNPNFIAHRFVLATMPDTD